MAELRIRDRPASAGPPWLRAALADPELRQSLGLLLRDLHPLDARPAWALGRTSATIDSTASASPSKTASTVPSGMLRTQPLMLRERAIRRAVSRKKTPWTRPWTTTRLRITASLGLATRSR